RTTAQLKRVLGRACHNSILSNDRVPTEPGTVQRGYRAFTAYATCYAPRYELAVLAPQSVLTLARDFDKHARDLRDVVIEGTNIQSQGGERMRKYLDAMKLVHAAMRADLGADEGS
ncbi:hypothetical protein, partial [Streptomyces sp. NPDC001137]|uniref:hypothetical protein n=1 Tax=Streptomyces sp. NPDC001137 TaxID=3154378 RepID=UPI0033262759